MNKNFGTLSETINGLVKLGYTHNFNIKDECIVCNRANITLAPNEFQIDHVYRFEGDSDPEYQSYFTPFHLQNLTRERNFVNS